MCSPPSAVIQKAKAAAVEMSAAWVDLSPPPSIDQQHRALLHAVHAPAGAEKLAHLPNASAHWLDITQVSQLGLSQAQRQALASELVLHINQVGVVSENEI
jgi:hypothetical protein